MQHSFEGRPPHHVHVIDAPVAVQCTAHEAVYGRSDQSSHKQSERLLPTGACSLGASEGPVGWCAALEWMEEPADTGLD